MVRLDWMAFMRRGSTKQKRTTQVKVSEHIPADLALKLFGVSRFPFLLSNPSILPTSTSLPTSTTLQPSLT